MTFHLDIGEGCLGGLDLCQLQVWLWKARGVRKWLTIYLLRIDQMVTMDEESLPGLLHLLLSTSFHAPFCPSASL